MEFEPVIRKFKKEDIQPFHEAVMESIDTAYKWLPWCHPGYTLHEAAEWFSLQHMLWDQHREFNFLISDRKTGIILGGTGINSIHPVHKFAFIGYWVRTKCMNKGVGTRATLQTVHYAFDELGLHRVEILMATGNDASRRVAEKTGAVYEGIARKKLLLHNVPVDAHVFSIIRDDMQ